MTSIQDMLAFERLIPERLRFEVTQWAACPKRFNSGHPWGGQMEMRPDSV